MGPLILNFSIYAFFGLFFYLKDKEISIRVILFLFVSFISLCAVYTWSNHLYFELSKDMVLNKLTYIPYLLFALALLCVYLPVMRFNSADVLSITVPDNGKLKILIIFSSIIGGMLVVLMIKPLLGVLSGGFGQMYVDSKEGGLVFSGLVYKLYTIYLFVQIPLMLYWGFYLTNKNLKFKKVVFFFVVAFMPSILFGLAGGSRGMLFFRILDVLIVVFLFRRFIDKKYLKIGFVLIFGLILLLLLVSIIITKERFGEGDIVFKMIAQYFGEPFLNSALHFYGNLYKPLKGENMFPDFYRLISGNNVKSFDSAYDSWRYFDGIIHLRIWKFKLLPIAFYIEFGAVGAIIAIIILSLFGFSIMKKKKEIPFYRLIWIMYYLQICFGSMFTFTKSGHHNLVTFIGLLLVYLYLRVDFFRLKLPTY